MKQPPDQHASAVRLWLQERQGSDLQKRRLEQLYQQLQCDLSLCEDPEQRLVISRQLLLEHIERLNQAISRFSDLIEQHNVSSDPSSDTLSQRQNYSEGNTL